MSTLPHPHAARSPARLEPRRPYPNRLGVKGWATGGRWGLERYLYTLHRLTGLGLVLYFMAHVVVTSSRALGAESWQTAMAAVGGPLFKAGEMLVFAAFAFHAVNGLRLVLVELGVITGPAEEPVYPYRSSLHVQRPWALAALALAALLTGLAVWQLLVLGH